MKRGIALITVFALLGTTAPFANASTQSSSTTATNSSSTAPTSATIWIVKNGDSLWKISQTIGVPSAQIAKYNGISNMNVLYVGQGIKIPSVWTVKPSDTLWKIAQATNSSVNSIAQINSLANVNQIQVGSTLIIPSDTTTYTVQSGDTLWKIAHATGVAVQALAQANSLSNPDSLTVGQVLQIPPASPAVTTGSTSPIGAANPETTLRQDVAVVLSDGAKVKLPYTYENANGMEITFKSMSRESLSMTVTNTDPLDGIVLQPSNWSVTAAGGYDETAPNYVDPSLTPDYFSGNKYAYVAPGQSITGAIGFGVFGADNGQFTLHFGLNKGDSPGTLAISGGSEQDAVTFATGTNAAGATVLSTPPTDETVTVNAAKSTITLGSTDPIWSGTSPTALAGTPTFQISAIQGGDSSTASVDPTTNLFTAKAPGKYQVSATINGISSTAANSAVIHVLGSPATIAMASTTYQFALSPTTYTLNGTVKDQSGSNIPYAAVSYASDNSSIVSANGNATTDQNGNFSIPLSLSSVGTAHITINAGSASTVLTVNVGPAGE